MDKLITTYTGKMPFVQEDLNWLDQTFRDAINHLFKDFPAIMELNCIVSGCGYSEAGGVVTVEPGWVLLQNEMIYFAGDSITGTAANCKITYEDSYDAAGAKVFANGVSHNVYFKRRGKLVLSTAQYYIRVVGERLRDRIRAQMVLPWITAALTGSGWTNVSLKYRQVAGGVHISGSLTSNDDPDVTVMTLPAAYRPLHQVSIALNTNDYANTNAVLTIKTTGAVEINAYPSPQSQTFSINTIIPQ